MHVQLIRSHGRGVWLEREHLHSSCIAITYLPFLRRTNHRVMKARTRRGKTFVVDRFITKSNGHHYHLAIGSHRDRLYGRSRSQVISLRKKPWRRHRAHHHIL